MRVVITGASSGIGEALAKHYASRGATLALVARRRHELERLAGVLPCLTFIYPLDVTDAEGLKAAAADFIARAGVPDLVIGNAGISVGTLTQEAGDLPAFERVFAVNVVGLFNTFHPFIAAMREAGRGTLAGIASVAGIRGLRGRKAHRPRHRFRHQLRRGALADGHRRQAAAPAAELPVRPAVFTRRAQAAHRRSLAPAAA